jgi:sugar transferase (PEP-CTERM/EpsH1 system associated)
MKILWVKSAGLFPPDTGGKIRSYNILRQLAAEHSVTLFTFYAAHENDLHPQLASAFDRAYCMPLRLPKPKSAGELRDYLMNSISLHPYNIAKYCRRPVRRALRTLLSREPFDVIVCDFIFAAGVVPWDAPCAKVLFAHNVEAAIWRQHFDAARNRFWKMLSWREWKTMERAERKVASRADHVLTVSESDCAAFRKFIAPNKVSVLPTGVDSDYFRPSGEEEQPNSLVFTGSMDWMPNEDAISYFIEAILPRVRETIPDASLTVVGRSPSSRLRALMQRTLGVEFTGWVDDVRPYVAKSALFIVPLRIGGGTRIKIFEAMAMGKAVISTSIGAEGLPVKNGENIVLADDPGDMAHAVVTLLRDGAERRRLGAASRRFVCDNYSWARVAQIFGRVLGSVTLQQRVTHHGYQNKCEPGALLRHEVERQTRNEQT